MSLPSAFSARNASKSRNAANFERIVGGHRSATTTQRVTAPDTTRAIYGGSDSAKPNPNGAMCHVAPSSTGTTAQGTNYVPNTTARGYNAGTRSMRASDSTLTTTYTVTEPSMELVPTVKVTADYIIRRAERKGMAPLDYAMMIGLTPEAFIQLSIAFVAGN